MYCVIGSLVLGAAAGGATRKITWRPFVKTSFKQGIVLSRKMRSIAAAARDQAERLVDEARAELDGTPRPSEHA